MNPAGSTSGTASFAAAAVGSDSLTVSVAGTDLMVEVGANGRFMITNVPAGRVQLRFMGPGTDAVVDIGIVESTQTVDIVVRVNGSTAALESVASDDSSSESADSASDDDSVDDDSVDDESSDDDSADDDSADDDSADDDSADDDSEDEDSEDDS